MEERKGAVLMMHGRINGLHLRNCYGCFGGDADMNCIFLVVGARERAGAARRNGECIVECEKETGEPACPVSSNTGQALRKPGLAMQVIRAD